MLVIVVAALFPMLAMATFAIDVSHWFDYSRNLQNRADAAALAGGAEFGGVCFTGGNPGNTTSGAQSSIGKYAQLYSGLSAGENNANHFYSDATESTLTVNGATWNVTNYGYINNTLAASPVHSPLTLRAGLNNINNFWLAFNASNWAPVGAANTNFSMNAGGAGATFCSSDPTYDQTDAQCKTQPHGQTSGPCAVAPMVDVKLTQKNIPLFIPLFSGLNPTVHAHARVTLQGEASSPTAPIAVGDTAFTPCVSVNLVNASTNAVIQNVQLPNRTQVLQTDPVQWSSNPTSFTMPASANVYVQPVLSDCQNQTQTYDDSTNTGVLMINNHPSSDPTVASGSPPLINTGGVTVSGGPCGLGTQYLADGACTVQVDVSATFASDVTPANNRIVKMIQRTWDNTNNVWVTSSPAALNRPGQGGCPATAFCGNVTLGDTSGIDEFSFTWEEDAGKIGATTCGTGNGHSPPPCTGQFNGGAILQQAFGACNGCDQPDDSGPVIFARISEGANNDVNTLASGSHTLVFTLKLAGLNTQPAGSTATVLRFSASSNHQTGLVDCGQGNGSNADAYTVYGGCGPSNTHFTPPLNPLFVNTRNTCGTPPGPPWPNTNQQDCVQTTPGQRRQAIICPLILRIVKGPFNTTCNSVVGTCPANNFGGSIPGDDPRAVTMILTSDIDLAATSGPQAWIPIRQFATFYVTGWDSKLKPQCPGNQAFPVKGKKNADNGAVWGYWINYTDFGGTTNGQPCPLNSTLPVNCVPVLTR